MAACVASYMDLAFYVQACVHELGVSQYEGVAVGACELVEKHAFACVMACMAPHM